jgi:hypothetical protein
VAAGRRAGNSRSSAGMAVPGPGGRTLAIYVRAGARDGLSVWPTGSSQIQFRACQIGQLRSWQWDSYFPGFDYRPPGG